MTYHWRTVVTQKGVTQKTLQKGHKTFWWHKYVQLFHGKAFYEFWENELMKLWQIYININSKSSYRFYMQNSFLPKLFKEFHFLVWRIVRLGNLCKGRLNKFTLKHFPSERSRLEFPVLKLNITRTSIFDFLFPGTLPAFRKYGLGIESD